MSDKKNIIGDTIIKQDVIQTTFTLNTPFKNDNEMIEAIKSHRELKGMIPDDDDGCDEIAGQI